MTTQSPTPGYNSDDATSTAVEILWWWFFELGPEEVWFGPSNSLTQDVAHDPGMDWFRQEWARAGYQVPFELEHHADPRGGTAQDIVVGMGVFVREHLIELPRAVGEMVWSYATGRPSAQPPGEVTAVGGVIGSLDQIVVSEAGPCTVRIEVINHTDWKSGLRIYGTDESLLPPYEREAWGPGGRLTEHFYWWEPWPYCGRR